jgi:hypothetical protein
MAKGIKPENSMATTTINITFARGAEVTNHGIYIGDQLFVWPTGCRAKRHRLTDKAKITSGDITSNGDSGDYRLTVAPGTTIDVVGLPATFAGADIAAVAAVATKYGILIDIVTDGHKA